MHCISFPAHRRKIRNMILNKRLPVRILHVVFVMNYGGGIERCLMHLLSHIDRDRFRLDFLVHVMPPSYPYTEKICALGSKILICSDPRQNLLQPWLYARTFKQILHEHGPYDIIHSHAAPFDGAILRLAQQVEVPVRIVHSHNNITPSMKGRGGFFRWFYYVLSKGWITQYATNGFGVSFKAAAAMFGSGWKTDSRWQIIPFGIDLSPFQDRFNSESVRAELGIPTDAFVIGHVGRFEGQKNHSFLIDIAAEVAKRESRLRLLLVGDGSLRSDIKQKVVQVGLADRVIFAGVRSDVPQLMRGAMDVFIFPSLYEGLGLALVEAQAAGLPCIFSDTVPEEADVVKPLMKRISLLQTASAWAELVLNVKKAGPKITKAEALKLVEQSPFNIQTTVKELEKLYLSQFSIYSNKQKSNPSQSFQFLRRNISG